MSFPGAAGSGPWLVKTACKRIENGQSNEPFRVKTVLRHRMESGAAFYQQAVRVAVRGRGGIRCRWGARLQPVHSPVFAGRSPGQLGMLTDAVGATIARSHTVVFS